MSRPEVTLDNYQEVYEYYTEHEPSKLALKGLHRAMSLVYWPRVHYANGAADRITELLDSDHRLFMACNHVNMFDQLPVASAMQRGPLRPVIGNTIALAKQPYFRNPVVRRALDIIGGIPVYRGKDTEGWDRSQRLQVSHLLFETIANHVEAGKHVFLFPEGTRNRGNPAELAKLQSGIGHMVMESIRRDVPVAVVPMALWYGKDTKHSLRPELYIGEPIEAPFDAPRGVTGALTESMAYSLDMARELANAPAAQDLAA